MPTADGPDPVLWVALPDGARGEVYAAWQLDGVRARRLELLRESQWATEVGRAGALRATLDAAFDELEVAR
jgi:hypothetical protein